MNMLRAKNKDFSWQFLSGEIPFDISSITKEVLSFSEEWKYDTSRQDKMTTHKDTEMFQLKFMPYTWQKGDGNISKDVYSLKNENSIKALNSIYELLENLYDGKVVRTEIIKMSGRGKIATHIDSGEFLSIGRRVHIPLITNKNVLFTVFNQTINMEVGNWYEINNCLPHSVDNNSDEIRIHIIIDILENKWL